MRLRTLFAPRLQDQPFRATFRSFRGVPAPTWTLGAGLFARGISLVGVVVSPPGSVPVSADRVVFAAYCMVVGAAMFTLGRRLPDWFLQAQVAIVVTTTAWFLASAPVLLSIPINLLALSTACVYMGVWFTAAQIGLHLAYMGILITTALLSRADFYPGLLTLAATGMLTSGAIAFLLHKLMRHMSHLASVDPLTGSLTRSGLALIVDHPDVTHVLSQPVTVAILDLDQFKALNDSEGHAYGDEVLRKVGRGLAEGTRSSDVVARIGGDEFLVILPGTQVSEAEAILRRLLMDLPIAASSGIAPWRPGVPFDEAVSLADASMYRDKERRRTRPPIIGSSGSVH